MAAWTVAGLGYLWIAGVRNAGRVKARKEARRAQRRAERSERIRRA
jgi:hypothetical protein